ncbi:hypothetical protein [Salinibaculum rarum]|uniref:hypothetical protein n=1 Tax=Salinibaculum rarum TaxID=3058903 RepID=UPI00265E07F6|nr:hypothetical protein [Salinibaculum sp. KK48]
MPEQVLVDTEPVDVDVASDAVESLRSESGLFRSAKRIASVRSFYYPVYVVEYGYQKTTGFLRKSKVTERDEFLVDGMDAGHTRQLQQYCDAAESPVQTIVGTRPAEPDFPNHFDSPLVLESQLSRSDARDYLQVKLGEIGERVTEKREEIRERVEDLKMQGQPEAAKKQAKQLDDLDGDELYDELREMLYLPNEFSKDTFAGVSNVELVYLPFWVVKVHCEGGGDEFVAFRDVKSGLTGQIKPSTVDWVADWFMEDVSIADLFDDTGNTVMR